MQTIKEKLFWGAVNSGTTQILNILFGFVLGRLIAPSEYGIIALLSIFTALAGNLQDSGFSTALVNRKNISHQDYNSVFWFSTLTSLSIYTILFFCAPLIAHFFHQPALVPLARFLFLMFIFSAMGIPHGAIMTREMMNKEKAIIGFLALFGSGVIAATMAFKGMSYWSLAWQQVLYNAIMFFGRFYYTKWRPALRFSLRPIREMFSFSNKLLIASIINSINNNYLSLFLGRLFSTTVVGNYGQANKWNTMAYSFVSNTMAQIAQPVLVRLTDEQAREKLMFRKMVRFVAFVSFPVMFGLSLVSHEFIIVTLKERWADSVPLLRMLCISGAFGPFYTLYQNLSISHTRSDIYMGCNVAQVLLQFALIFFVAPYGIQAIVNAYSLFFILWILVWHFFTARLISLSLYELLSDLAPFLFAAAAVMLAVHFLTLPIQNLYLLLGTRILLAAALYAGIMKLFHVDMMDEMIAYFFNKKR